MTGGEMEPIRFWVPGVPAPGGSKRAFAHARTGKIIVLDDAKRNKPWRSQVAAFALGLVPEPLACPLDVTMTFVVTRPKGHFGTGRNAGVVKASAPAYPTVKPDVLKLARSTEDALTGVIWTDDCMTVKLTTLKQYGTRPGVLIEVREMDDEPRGA